MKLAILAAALLLLTACSDASELEQRIAALEAASAAPPMPADYTITGKAVYIGVSGETGPYVSFMLFGEERELLSTTLCYDLATVGETLIEECRKGLILMTSPLRQQLGDARASQ